MTTTRLMRGKLRRHREEAVLIASNMALQQRNDVLGRCHVLAKVNMVSDRRSSFMILAAYSIKVSPKRGSRLNRPTAVHNLTELGGLSVTACAYAASSPGSSSPAITPRVPASSASIPELSNRAPGALAASPLARPSKPASSSFSISGRSRRLSNPKCERNAGVVT